MTERPILFSGEMVRAILDGRKTQTRRVVKQKPPEDWRTVSEVIYDRDRVGLFKKRGKLVEIPIPGWYFCDNTATCGASSGPFKCPYGQPGDRLWVKEGFSLPRGRDNDPPSSVPTWSLVWHKADGQVRHRARSPGAPRGRWRPSIHMPRWASRISLLVKDVRVERVQNISGDDARAEGVVLPPDDDWPDEPDYSICPTCGGTGLYVGLGNNYGVVPDCDCTNCDTEKKRFRHLWNNINEHRGHGWDKNPWVWVVEFEVHR